MAKRYRLKVGSTVLCRLYNTPERRFYGLFWKGKVLSITEDDNGKKQYLVTKPMPLSPISLRRKEIRRILS